MTSQAMQWEQPNNSAAPFPSLRPCRRHARHDQVRSGQAATPCSVAACTMLRRPAVQCTTCPLQACAPAHSDRHFPLSHTCSLSIEVRGPSRDLHSGNEGGVFTEPLADLSKVPGGGAGQGGAGLLWCHINFRHYDTSLCRDSPPHPPSPLPHHPLATRCWPAWLTATTTSWCPASTPTCGQTCCR